MKRGRIFIYLALIIVVVVVGGALYLNKKGIGTGTKGLTLTQTAAAVKYVHVVSAAQPIAAGAQITEAMLTSYQIPETNLVQGLYTDPRDVINMYAKVAIPQGQPITANQLASTAGNINLPGSTWAQYIPQGLTAVSIPISRLSAAAYSIRDGDYVNVIATVLLVDLNPDTQTIMPNKVAGLVIAQGLVQNFNVPNIYTGIYTPQDIPNAMDYIYPSEDQRPRMVTQMIMQNIQVLHVGTFPLPGEANSDQLNSQAANEAAASGESPTPTPTPSSSQSVAPALVKPDVITLMVTPQDAVTLMYLVNSKAEINLTLRNPNDQNATAQPDAAMLEYLLTQYNIPVPAKLPYSLSPRVDAVQEPSLPNDSKP